MPSDCKRYTVKFDEQTGGHGVVPLVKRRVGEFGLVLDRADGEFLKLIKVCRDMSCGRRAEGQTDNRRKARINGR